MTCLPAGSDRPYQLRAEFDAIGSSRQPDKGEYQDTWISNTQWRREASFGKSHYIRSRNGDQRYELAEGPDANLLRFIFQVVEPAPATDGFVESDWRIKRDLVNGIPAIRVLSGYESPEGKLDPEQARGYWFDSAGLLLKLYLHGPETYWSDFQPYGSMNIAREVDVRKEGQLMIRFQIKDISPSPTEPDDYFRIKHHEWKRVFTAEER